MITRIPHTGYGTVEQREKPPRNESFTQRKKGIKEFAAKIFSFHKNKRIRKAMHA
jgi:nucleoid DNA-binding protein